MITRKTGWTAIDSQDDSIATATKAAVSGDQYIIYAVSASFSAASTKLLQIKDGSTVIWEDYVVNSTVITFPGGLTITASAATSAVLAASGTSSVIGKVNLHGVTL